jgi:AraC-like DNA-binding protein
MPTQLQTGLLRGIPTECPIGRISLAGSVVGGRGTVQSGMRILGSYALAYVLRGPGRYMDGNGINQKLETGDLIHLFPDIPHAYGPPPGESWDEIFIVFDGPLFDLWRSAGLLDQTKPVRQLLPLDYWLRRIESVATADAAVSPLTAVSRLQDLLAEMCQCGQSADLGTADRAWLATARQLLAEPHAPEDAHLQLVAARLDMSYVGFRKKFSRLSGISPGSFHMKSIMDRACDMLRAGDFPLRTIAAQLGFCDEFHFSRRFKQLVGLSPTQFRRQASRS